MYNTVKVLYDSRKKTLLKKACFKKFYRPKIHLETAQKNGHLPNEVSNKEFMSKLEGVHEVPTPLDPPIK